MRGVCPPGGEKFGGASRDRTDDLIVANDALSQLSYSPTRPWIFFLILAAIVHFRINSGFQHYRLNSPPADFYADF
jgi:hypothetical protein